MFPRSDLRFLDERWHEIGRRAKETTSSLDEWSDRDIKRWDLDTDSRRPTGRENPRTWRYEKPLRDVNRPGRSGRTHDARDNPRINDAPDR